jgi:cellulose biosynthesis protein BcsQ
MAMANVGVLMALDGCKVLLVDWDLEAPGLEAYFQNTSGCKLDGDPETKPGIVDLLEARIAGTDLPWQKCLLTTRFRETSLHMISAGRRSEDYRKRVQQLDWKALFEHHKVGNYLNGLREEWRGEYDYILIDSRTGITDIGDICTVLMPDALVMMFVSNRQNVDGVKSIIGRAREARRKLPVNRSMLSVLPIAGRDESNTEYEQSLRWREIFATELGGFFKEWLPKEVSPSDALNKLYIPYVPI